MIQISRRKCFGCFKEFNAVLSEAVDEGLKAVLGEAGREVVYYHLQSVYGLRRHFRTPRSPYRISKQVI